MKRFQFLAIFLVIVMVLLTSCSVKDNAGQPLEIESSVAEPPAASGDKPENEPKQQADERSVENSRVDSSDAEISEISAQPTPEEPLAPDPPMSDSSYIKRWDERTVSEKYGNVGLNGSLYHVGREKIDPLLIGESLGESSAFGYDAYENEQKKTIKCSLYSLKSISPKCAVAVKYEGWGGYFPFSTYDYVPATLGDLIHDLNLRENFVFNKIYYSYWKDGVVADGNYIMMEYTLPDTSVIWDLLLSDTSIKNAGDAHYIDSIMGVSIDVKVIGAKNIALSVNEDGYLQTNILATGKSFFIGQEKVQAFIDYVLDNGKGEILGLDGNGDDIAE